MRKPSVSELLEIMAKPALIPWANKMGLKGVDISTYSKKKMADGTSIHSQIQYGAFDNEEDAIAYSRFMSDKICLCQEQEIETDWFVGRYDAMLSVNGDKFIVDYKRGYKGKLYIENKLQLIAYTMAEPARMAIVGVPKFVLHEFVPANRGHYEEIIKSLYNIWAMLRETRHD